METVGTQLRLTLWFAGPGLSPLSFALLSLCHPRAQLEGWMEQRSSAYVLER